MANNVVLGDLSKYSGEDCLKFDGVAGRVVTNCLIDGSHRIEIDLLYEGNGAESASLCSTCMGMNGIDLYIDSGGVVWYEAMGLGPSVGGVIAGNRYKIIAETVGSILTLTVNGVTSTHDVSFVEWNDWPAEIMAMPDDTQRNTKGEVYSYNISMGGITRAEFPSGSWGDTTLPDGSSMYGGVTWWKKDVDETFLTPTAYRSAWNIPMEEDQKVIYADAEPQYLTSDAFWNPYNQSVDYLFTVMIDRSMLFKLIFTFGEFKMVGATKEGSTIGTGTSVSLERQSYYPYPSQISATSSGTLVVKFRYNSAGEDFTTINVLPEGTMYPIGEITHVNVDESTVNMDNVTFGYASL